MDANRMLAAFCAALILSGAASAQFQPSREIADLADLARPGQNASNVPVRVTKNPNFGIPFEIATTSGDVSEVQLHVSTDQGQSWQRYQSQAPGANGFQFRANGDGEYWFAVRTIGRGQENRGPFQPELKVVVDTQLPKLNIRVLSSPNGQANADWLAQDDNLDASSFRIKYQNQEGEWHDVPFTKPSSQDLRKEWQGQTQWWLRTRGSDVAVRAEVFDRAGNSKVVTKRISIQNNQSGVGDDKIADNSFGRRPINGKNTPVGQSFDDLAKGIRKKISPFLGGVQHADKTFGAASPQSWANSEPATPGRRGVSDQFERQPISRPVSKVADQTRTRPISSTKSQFEQGIPDNKPRFSNRSQSRPIDQREPRFADRRDDRIESPSFDEPGDRFENTRYATTRPTQRFDTSRNAQRRTQQQFQDPYASRQSERSRVSSPVSQRRPLDSRDERSERTFHPRITSSPDFELVYDLYGINPNDQRQVELWITQDRGSSWDLFGRDADGQSPVEVRLRSEGLYGFQLIVDSGRGRAPTPPQRNDEPDVWVIVDWTKPTAQISRVEMPNGPNSREITIEWIARDTAALADAPITLSYSDNPNGPWTPFTRNISNAGAYLWRVDRRLPERLYIQLEVRDMAGNVSSDIYDGSGGPSGRIRDVRPIVR